MRQSRSTKPLSLERPRVRLATLALTAVATAVSCTVQDTPAPNLTGPSEFGLSVQLTATPDSITQDGASQSTIAITARDAGARPRSGLAFRLEIRVTGAPADYGTLSARTVTTGADGRATALYTAPPPAPPGSTLPTCAPSVTSPDAAGPCVQIAATPVSSGFTTVVTHTVDIHLVPAGVVSLSAPTAQFTFAPSSPAAASPVQFDASASCPGPTTPSGCQVIPATITSYRWDFGDGTRVTTGSPTASHAFALQQTYTVTLTVTNSNGASGSTSKPVTVGAGSPPTASFVFSPTEPKVNTSVSGAPSPGSQVFFSAEASRAGAGHVLVDYLWNWGDGSTGRGVREEHDWTVAGTYTVVLTVVDEAGQRGTTSAEVTVSP